MILGGLIPGLGSLLREPPSCNISRVSGRAWLWLAVGWCLFRPVLGPVPVFPVLGLPFASSVVARHHNRTPLLLANETTSGQLSTTWPTPDTHAIQ